MSMIKSFVLAVGCSAQLLCLCVPCAAAAIWATHGPEGAHVQALAIDYWTPATIYLGTAPGAGTSTPRLFKSTDGGNHWASVGFPGVDVTSLAIDPSTAALTTSDYALLQRETQALIAITKNPVWSELITPDLRPYTSGFARALADLPAASERRDYDSAGASYGALTKACIDCHKHVAKSRVADVPRQVTPKP